MSFKWIALIVFEKMTRTKTLTNAHADADDQVMTLPRLFSSKSRAKNGPTRMKFRGTQLGYPKIIQEKFGQDPLSSF